LACPSFEPVVEEGIDTRSPEPALAHFTLPPRILELLPVLGADLFGRLISGSRRLEQEVLDEIRRSERSSSRVECLEDDKGIVAGPEVDDDELQQTEQRRLQGLCPQGAIS